MSSSGRLTLNFTPRYYRCCYHSSVVSDRYVAAVFDVAAEAYDRFMGRYSAPLAPQFADFAGHRGRAAGARRRLRAGRADGRAGRRGSGLRHVAAVDPSEPFVEAARARHPGVDVRQASAERLPFATSAFDAALAQLVVHFMADPVPGLGEMARVTRPGGVVAACVWDHGGGAGPLSLFWEAAHELDPDGSPTSRDLAGAREGHLAELFAAAGLRRRRGTALSVARRARELRRVVGAVHARRRPGRRVRRAARRRAARAAPRALPRGVPSRRRRPRLGLDRARPRLEAPAEAPPLRRSLLGLEPVLREEEGQPVRSPDAKPLQPAQ